MKNALFAVLLCLGVTACLDDQSAPTDDQTAVADDNTARQSQGDLQVTGHELDPTAPNTNSCFIGAQPCIDGNVHTCNFECCDHSGGAVRSACGNCLGHANDFCQTFGHGGTLTAWWTF